MQRQSGGQLGIVLLGIVLSIVGVVSGVAGIVTQFGLYGVAISAVAILVIVLLSLLLLRPVLSRNLRGISVLESLASVGLVDVEDRDDMRALPPSRFYQLARREIAITGVSAYRTFDQHIGELKAVLDHGKKVFVLVLHPESPDVLEKAQAEAQDVRNQLAGTIAMIKSSSLHRHPNFHIRFLWKLPPFTAVMIDGDLLGEAKTGDQKPGDQNAQIRVQPGSAYSSQRKGIIVQLRKVAGKEGSPLDYFADDLRKQWQNATELPNLFET